MCSSTRAVPGEREESSHLTSLPGALFASCCSSSDLGWSRPDLTLPGQCNTAPTNQHLKSTRFSTSLVEAEGLVAPVVQGGQRHRAGGLEHCQGRRGMASYLSLTED